MAYADLSTRKTQARLSATLNESASHASHLASTSFARRQLEKMGWTEGTGLGRNRDGMVGHIRTKKREESVGLGSEKRIVEEAGDAWWKESVGSTLARLQARHNSTSGDDDGKKKKKKKKSKKKDYGSKKDKKKKKSKDKDAPTNRAGEIKIYSDHDLFAATGGARFGMRAQRRAEAKWSRTESGSKLWEEEVEARKKLEWNGLGAAKVLLNGGKATGSGSSSSADGSDGDSGSSGDADGKVRPSVISAEERTSVKIITRNGKDSESAPDTDKSEKEVGEGPDMPSSDEKDGKRKKKKKKKKKRRKSEDDVASQDVQGETDGEKEKKRRKMDGDGEAVTEASAVAAKDRKRTKGKKKEKCRD